MDDSCYPVAQQLHGVTTMVDYTAQSISTSKLRAEIKRVINEVGYGCTPYIVEKFGEPLAALICMDDYRLLIAAKQEQAAMSLRETIQSIRSRADQLEPDELDGLIEEARAEYHSLRRE
jgi:prevent-host-death family protein